MNGPQYNADYLRELHFRQQREKREKRAHSHRHKPEWIERQCKACGAHFIGHAIHCSGFCRRCWAWYDSDEEAIAAHQKQLTLF